MKTDSKTKIKNSIVIVCAAVLALAISQVQHGATRRGIAELKKTVDSQDAIQVELERERELRRYYESNNVEMGQALIRYQALFSEAVVRIRELSEKRGVAAMIPE